MFSMQMGLPVIVENNARTLVQERHDAVWIEEQRLIRRVLARC